VVVSSSTTGFSSSTTGDFPPKQPHNVANIDFAGAASSAAGVISLFSSVKGCSAGALGVSSVTTGVVSTERKQVIVCVCACVRVCESTSVSHDDDYIATLI
jgi:hypothetical protein